MTPKDRFRVLAAVALADGAISPGERALLLRSAAWLGIPLPVAVELVQEVRERGVPELEPPEEPHERRRLYQGMLNLVMADGRVDAAEVACLHELGAPFGLAPAVVAEMIAATERGWREVRAERTTSGRVQLQRPDPDATTRAREVDTGAVTLPETETPIGRACQPARRATPPESRETNPPLDPDALEPIGPGTLIAGRFLLGEQLGRGGFGAVFRAHHGDLGEDVALKVLRPRRAKSATAEQRFLREVKLSRSFAHRYAVAIREFGRDLEHGCLYFTMDLVPGRTLDRLLVEEGPLPFARLARLGGQALEALAEAHRAGIVHRDLKPANVLVTTGPTGEEEARIFDFGVAKAIDAAGLDLALTRAGCTVGTPTYMSPEQAMGLELDARSDVYALGVVIYECLCGCLPYALDVDAEDLQDAIFTELLSNPPLDPREVRPDLAAPAAEVLLRALEKRPSNRFPDALAFRDALHEAARACDGSGARRFTAWLGKRLGRAE